MEKKYNISYDILTIIACLMVVFFHIDGVVYQYSDTLSWKLSVVERCVVYSAVPIFFMLAGAKLMDYRSRCSTKEYITKRLSRVGIPFLFWNAFYVAYILFLPHEKSIDSVKDFISMFFNSEFQDRYWFFYPLFSVYAAIPVLSLVLQVENHRKYLWYAVFTAFGLNWVLVPLCGILGIRYNFLVNMPACDGYMMYAVLGYLLSTEVWNRKRRMTLYILALCSGIFAVWYTITASGASGKTQAYMFSYDYFPSALTGAAIFVFIKHLFEGSLKDSAWQRSGKSTNWIRTVSGCCMGVWLTHSLAIQVASLLTDLPETSYIWRLACPPIVFAACVAGTWIVKKIPIIKHVV